MSDLERAFDTGLAVDDQISQMLAPRYQYESVVGEGRTSKVIVCLDMELARQVAIKLLPKVTAGNVSDLFSSSQVELGFQLRHPYIVAQYELIDLQSHGGIVMQYAPKGNWAHPKLERSSSVSPIDSSERIQRIRDLIKVATAVEYMHQRGWTHGDLKPENVLVDAHGEPLLCDFGSSQRISQDVSDADTIQGTAAFLAPELASGESSSTASSDVYSLGVLLLFQISGRVPISGSVEQILHMVKSDGQPSMQSLGLPRDRRLQAILDKACNASAERRYDSAQCLADDLRRYLKQQPLQARQSGRAEQAWLWAKRNRLPAFMLFATLTVLSIGSTISAINWRAAFIESRRLAASEQQRLSKAAALRKSKADLELTIARSDAELMSATESEERLKELRDKAEKAKSESQRLLELAKQEEAEATRLQKQLEKSIEASLVASERLRATQSELGVATTRLSFIEQRKRQLEVVEAALADDWKTAKSLLNEIADQDRDYVLRRVKFAIDQLTWETPPSPIELGFTPYKAAITPSGRSLVLFSKQGIGAWCDLQEETNVDVSLNDADDFEIEDVTALSVSDDGSLLSAAVVSKGQRVVKTYQKTENSWSRIHRTTFTWNVRALRAGPKGVFAVVSSADWKQFGIVDVKKSKVIWKHAPKVTLDRLTKPPEISILQTDCSPSTSLVFRISEGRRHARTTTVFADFSVHPPTINKHVRDSDRGRRSNSTEEIFRLRGSIARLSGHPASTDPRSISPLQTWSEKLHYNRLSVQETTRSQQTNIAWLVNSRPPAAYYLSVPGEDYLIAIHDRWMRFLSMNVSTDGQIETGEVFRALPIMGKWARTSGEFSPSRAVYLETQEDQIVIHQLTDFFEPRFDSIKGLQQLMQDTSANN